MELEWKAECIVDEVGRNTTLKEFNKMLRRELSDLFRDEHKVKLLNLVSKNLKKELDEHHSDGSCKRRYPNGGCPTDIKYDNAFGYVEQEYDRIMDDFGIYGSLNRNNAHVFGEQFDLRKKNEIVDNLNLLSKGQISLAEGQLELYEEIRDGFGELKELLFILNKKHWTEVLRGQIFSAALGLGINTDVAMSLLHSLEKSIGI